MKTKRHIISCLVFVLFVYSCSSIQVNKDEKYQPVGTAVLTADGLFLVKYSQNQPASVPGDDYKDLLKEDYQRLYNRLAPYDVRVEKAADGYVVSVFDGDRLILADWLCTEGRIDCWVYNGECDPGTISVNCDK